MTTDKQRLDWLQRQAYTPASPGHVARVGVVSISGGAIGQPGHDIALSLGYQKVGRAPSPRDVIDEQLAREKP